MSGTTTPRRCASNCSEMRPLFQTGRRRDLAGSSDESQVRGGYPVQTNQNVIAAFEEASLWYMATCGEGGPNVVPGGFNWFDEKRLLVADLFFGWTRANLEHNRRVAVSVGLLNPKRGFQIRPRRESIATALFSSACVSSCGRTAWARGSEPRSRFRSNKSTHSIQASTLENASRDLLSALRRSRRSRVRKSESL